MPRQATAADPKPEGRRLAGRLLKVQAYDSLKSWIITGAYPPGTFLSERRLVEKLGMSKTPIRAALERLEGEGFVRVSPRQGIVVREPSLAEIADQFEIRLALERHVIESLAGNLAAAQVARLRDNLRRRREAAKGEDLAESIRLDSEFHLMLCELHGNQEILATMMRLREKMTWVIGLVFKQSDGRMVPNLREHEAIAEAIICGDCQAAVAGLRDHLEYGKRSLLSPRCTARGR
jgi:DNA-binding GntR family transcriptional regulator